MEFLFRRERRKGYKCSAILLSKNTDQWIFIKFCVKDKIKCPKTMLTVAYSEIVLSKKFLQVVQSLPVSDSLVLIFEFF